MKKLFFIPALLLSAFANAQVVKPVVNDTSRYAQKNVFTHPPVKAQHIKLRSFILPASLITYGFVALNDHGLHQLDKTTGYEIKEDHSTFRTTIDNYLQYAPAATVYGLNAIGIKGKNNFRDRTVIYALSQVIAAAFVVPVKNLAKVQRPDGSGFNSFPSGHTTTAFSSAEFMYQEYKDVSPVYGIAGYAMATATGVLRLYNNKHWLSDVVAGAGFGILSAKLAYLVYPAIKRKLFKKRDVNTVVVPYYQNNTGGLTLVHSFAHSW